MADGTMLDPSVRAALEKLADIAVPPPVSFVPQTWGWGLLGVLVVALIIWGLLRWHRHYEANRYRREALAAVARIERAIDDNACDALAEIPPLLKRVALAAWPRSRIASLAQGRWVKFLQATASEERSSASLANLLDDVEYRSQEKRAPTLNDCAHAFAQAAKHWIKTHRVSA